MYHTIGLTKVQPEDLCARIEAREVKPGYRAHTFLFGAVWEVSAHILRDVATAPISPWPPVSKAGVEISALAVRAGAPCHRRDAARYARA